MAIAAGTTKTANISTGDGLDDRNDAFTALNDEVPASTYDGINGSIAGIVVSEIAVIPEPSSTALIGLDGLALTLRRRR